MSVQVLFAPVPKLPIALFVARAHPRPASIGAAGFIDFTPEAFCERLSTTYSVASNAAILTAPTRNFMARAIKGSTAMLARSCQQGSTLAGRGSLGYTVHTKAFHEKVEVMLRAAALRAGALLCPNYTRNLPFTLQRVGALAYI
jgi:hypothetical protein